jgi:hypothetical protein
MFRAIIISIFTIGLISGCASTELEKKMTKIKDKTDKYERVVPFENLIYKEKFEKQLDISKNNLLGYWKCEEQVNSIGKVVSEIHSWYNFDVDSYSNLISISMMSRELGRIDMGFIVRGSWQLNSQEITMQAVSLEPEILVDDPWQEYYLYNPSVAEIQKSKLLVKNIEQIIYLSKDRVNFLDREGVYSECKKEVSND